MKRVTRYPSSYIRSSRYIRASLSPSVPNWLREFINNPHSDRYVLHKLGVKLDTANFSDRPTGNSLSIYLIEADDEDVLYIPGVNDDDNTFRFNGRRKAIGSLGKRELANRTKDVIYLDRDDPANFDKKPDSARYTDPRYGRGFPSSHGFHRGAYGGQTKLNDGRWTESGDGFRRDKSGYAIPDPEERIKKYYERFPEKMTDKIDSLYEELMELQREIYSQDWISDINSPDYSSRSYASQGAIYSFKRAVDDYKALLKIIDQETGEFRYNRVMNRKYAADDFATAVDAVRQRIRDVKNILNR